MAGTRFSRNVFLGLTLLTAVLLFIVLLLPPANVPTSLGGLDLWLRAHWTVFIWLMVAFGILDFVFAFDRFQMETRKRLESLEKQMAGLRNDGRRDPRDQT